ncbi:hypothetical protein HanRHA438_Chr03g0108481 [Helianthus annuus]|nr:hypothetical protein HanIR_Chr03g0106281 [Helianthus annuus]KAJ0934532.1 hypothetical protein HanRHA438_Chr03g0108481 [Helianthus annuus]
MFSFRPFLGNTPILIYYTSILSLFNHHHRSIYLHNNHHKTAVAANTTSSSPSLSIFHCKSSTPLS